MSPTRLPRIIPIALLGLALACDSGSDPEEVKQAIGSAVQDNLAGVKDQVAEVKKAVDSMAERQAGLQERIAANADKLDQIAEKLDEMAAAPTPTPTPTPAPTPTVKPGRPDPSVTYKVALGDAQTRGPDTALVTIVEWSDFQ